MLFDNANSGGKRPKGGRSFIRPLKGAFYFMKGRTDQTLHEVLRQIPYGLYVVGVRNENEMTATVVSWAMQCSFFPPLIAVAIRKPSRTYDLIKAGNTFTLNFIDKDDEEIIRRLVRPAEV